LKYEDENLIGTRPKISSAASGQVMLQCNSSRESYNLMLGGVHVLDFVLPDAIEQAC
jgi:hypothetical protein